MKTIQFEVPGIPQALKRHRAFRMAGGIRMVDPSANDKSDFLTLAMKHKPDTALEIPLHVHCTFVFPRPKGHYGTGKNSLLLKPSAPYFHTSIPDVDNLTKFVGDSLNGKFWKDDSYIVRLEGLKVYTSSWQPKIIITIADAVPIREDWREIVNEENR